jgi:hypothetical protein
VIIQRWDLRCDRDRCAVWATNLVAATATEARDVAARLGWRRARTDSELVDLCPACASGEAANDESRQPYCGPDCPRVDHTICLFDATHRAQRLEHRHEFDVGAPADYWLGVIAAQVDVDAGRERDGAPGLLAPLDWLRGYDDELAEHQRTAERDTADERRRQ